MAYCSASARCLFGLPFQWGGVLQLAINVLSLCYSITHPGEVPGGFFSVYIR